MKRIKLKRQTKGYAEGVKAFDEFIRVSRKHIDEMKGEGKEMYLFLAGYYQGCKKEEQQKKNE